MRNKRRYRILLGFVAGGLALWGGLYIVGYLASAARWRHAPLAPGTLSVPQTRSLRWHETSMTTGDLVSEWAATPLPDWQEEGKVTAPRALMGRFALCQDLEAANAYLQAQEPWGRSGSTWELHPEGDYDFTLAALTAILWLYGDDPDVLFPDTRAHLLETLLVEEGGSARVTVPRTLGFIRDTENHLLMTEGSRYLKNRWLMLHGDAAPLYDNVQNGMEAWMLQNLEELRTAGLYEFNSIPYMGYTLTALMNLEAFGSDDVRAAAREVLDRANWVYALGSLDTRRFAPFRRQLRRADLTGLDVDYQTSMVRTWMSRYPGASMPEVAEGRHHALWAALLPYQLPDETARWILDKPAPYFVRIGHGPLASPEIYAGGPGYLLSAGGVHRGARSMIAARPITLMLEDGATDLSQVLHVAGPGDAFRDWNNTGVHRDFAVAAGPVHVPESWVASAASDVWTVYSPSQALVVAVHSHRGLGLIALFHTPDAGAVLAAVSAANADPLLLERSFRWPDGPLLTYNTHAPRNRWVMVAVDEQALDRNFDGWPLLEGALE